MVPIASRSAALPAPSLADLLLLIVIIAVLAALPRPVAASTPDDSAAMQRPPAAESGRLFFRDAQGYTPAPLLQTDVRAAVSGMVARTVVTQRFRNPGAGWVEGIYVFPLPTESAVDRLRLTIGERTILGEIQERQQAARTYQAARAAGRRAGLVEQERPNIFTTSVANIGPDETVTVAIEFQESLRYDQGRFTWRFPLVAAPRYIPGEPLVAADRGWAPATTSVPDAPRITPPVRDPVTGSGNPVSLYVEIDAGMKLAAVESATHAIKTATDEHGRVTVTLADSTVPADRDFVLRWQPATGSAPSAGLFAEERDGARHLLLMLMPPAAAADARAAAPREMIFVIDTSGSMEGTSIKQARAALDLALDRLTPADRFNIIQFNSVISALFADPQPASTEALRMAHAYVAALRAQGGTEMLPALNLALDGTARPDRVRQVVFLTDGAVGNEDALFRRIEARLGDSRLFTIGIGSAPNAWFMTRAAQAGRGTFTNIDRVDEVAARMAALFEKLEKPVLTDIAVRWPNGVQAESYPAPIPDLYAGEPVVLAARMPDATIPAGSVVTISGRTAGQRWEHALSLDGVESRPGVAAVWARKKLAALADSAHDGAEQESVRAESIKLALAYGLISRYTSLVVVDTTPARPTGVPVERTEVPVNLPAGWSYKAVFGEQAAAPSPVRHALASATVGAQSAGAPVALPQTATAAEIQLILGALSLLAAVILLVQQFRRGRRP